MRRKREERDPDRLWLDDGECYLVMEDNRYVIVHDREQLGVYRGPEVLLQTTLLKYGDHTEDGILVKAAAVPWFEIFRQMVQNPRFMLNFARNPRKFEEFIAGAYHEAGWDEVTVTPSSGDKGRDVIATKRGLCSIRVLDQAKAYAPQRLVLHNDVRAMLGVLNLDQNASKGLITTTSDFEPGILSGQEFAGLIPYRLELKNGQQLLKWLAQIQGEPLVKKKTRESN